MINLNSILPSQIPHNEELTNEVALILQDVKEQTEKMRDSVKPCAYLKSIQGKSQVENKTLYNQDAIYEAVKYIKQSKYYCWCHTDYNGQLSVWVTRRNVRPHTWYRSM